MGYAVDLNDFDREDDAYERDRQRAVDSEMQAKRGASGMSPEILSMQDAFIAGQKAGMLGNGASLNPYQEGFPEHAEWNRGRLGAIGQALSRKSA